MSGDSGALAARELAAKLSEAAVKPHEVSSFLDGLGHDERVEAVRSLGRREQGRLYAAVDGFAPVDLADLVPASASDLEPVRHYGRNTLPAFTLFEKRFCRPEATDPQHGEQLYGYNYSPYAVVPSITGPGYFVAVPDPNRREVLVDYRQVPPTHPAGWPDIKRNEVGLSRFVFGFMVDTLRRVSEHVTIGSAARKGKDMGSWFVLCRES